MISLLKNRWLTLIGVAVGSIAGYLYWHFYGCVNGCAITSVWWRMTLYGAVFGGLIFDTLNDYLRKNGKF